MRRLALAVAVLALAGCVSLKRTPPARWYVLRSVAQAKEPPHEVPRRDGFVGLLPVRLAGALERPQLVAWAGPNEVRIDELSRWAEPLDAGITRTLAEDLAALLPRERVLRAPWPAFALARCRVATELSVFGPQPSGEVRLEAEFTLLGPREERVLLRRPVVATRTPAASDAGASVEAMSALVGEMAERIAEAIAALPVAESPAVPETPPGGRR